MKTAHFHPQRSTPSEAEPHWLSPGATPGPSGPGASPSASTPPTIHIPDSGLPDPRTLGAETEPRWLAEVATVVRGEATAELYAVTLDLILEHHTRLDEALIAIHSDEFGAHLTLTPESAHRLGIALVAATRAVLPSAAEVTSGGAASTEPPQSE